MSGFYLSYEWLHWTRPSGPPAALPKGIDRTYVTTPEGPLELLCARPAIPMSKVPVVFAHGGMGSAWVWTQYMLFLAQNGITSFAVSTRGHGESWHPSFLRMLYGTTKRMLGNDLVAGIKAVEAMERSEVVLVGHSSGGGLSQFIVNEGDVQVKGLGLLAAVPGTGSYVSPVAVTTPLASLTSDSLDVYLNWACFDPWFAIRMVFHGWHSNSPLSHPFLTRRAFFSDEYPEENLIEFQKHASRYESFLWPLGMMCPFVNARRLLGDIRDWGHGSERILVMAGTEDKLMTRDVQVKAASTYRTAYLTLVAEKKIDDKDRSIEMLEGEGGLDTGGCGVRQAWVPGAGHHVQNDVQWKVGAAKLLAWLRQL